MELRLRDISLVNFRNYRDFTLNSIGDLTVFVGKNAIGKTNLLEAIQLCSALDSFRHPNSAQLVAEGEDFSRLSASIEGDVRKLDIVMKVSAGRRQFFLNDKKKSIADLKGTLPAVIFTPDDLALVKNSSSLRREALDELGSQLTKNYYVVKHDYEKAVRYKNKLLKEEASPIFLQSINDTLLTCGAQLEYYRAELFSRLSDKLTANYGRLSDGEALESRYIPSWCSIDSSDFQTKFDDLSDKDFIKRKMSAAFDRALTEERARKRSLIGPHADKITLEIDRRNVADYASQGQRRSVVLAWKLAEVSVIRGSLNQNPILLLDDVMSELDGSRRESLVDLVEGDMQTFITTTNLSYFTDELLSRASVVELPATENAIRLS